MSLFMIKSILAIFFMLAAFMATFSMLTLMGKAERKMSTNILKRVHKTSGLVFIAFLLVISYLCLRYWAKAGDQISTRAVFHLVLSFAVIIILILKISIVRFYKQFLRFAPVLGITVFILSFVVFSISAGFFFLRTLCAKNSMSEVSSSQTMIHGDPEKGAFLFNRMCSSCHYTDREEFKQGPGLKNILKREKLPSSRRQANIENIKKQLRTPFIAMPSFSALSDSEIADLIAYLETL